MDKIKKQLMVSVLVTTYNHEEYIRQALDSILMQKVDFEYEIIVHDDASPDNTASIIREYEEKYPKLIKAIYQPENLYSKGIPRHKYIIKYLKGEYIAICEGDDYWTDPYKLKKQIEFLENNSSFIATYHNVRVIDENGNVFNDDKLYHYKMYPAHVFTLKDAEHYKLPGQSASLVYRNIWHEINEETLKLYLMCKTNGDKKLALLLALQGDIFCFSDVMADHRKIRTKGTSWSARTYGKNLSLFRYNSILEINSFAQKAFGVTLNNKKERLDTFYSAFKKLCRKPNRENWEIFRKLYVLNVDKGIEANMHILTETLSCFLRRIKRLMGISK